MKFLPSLRYNFKNCEHKQTYLCTWIYFQLKEMKLHVSCYISTSYETDLISNAQTYLCHYVMACLRHQMAEQEDKSEHDILEEVSLYYVVLN